MVNQSEINSYRHPVIYCRFFAAGVLVSYKVSAVMLQKEHNSNLLVAKLLAQQINPAMKFRKRDNIEKEFDALATEKVKSFCTLRPTIRI